MAIAFAGGVTRDLLVTRVPLGPQSPVEPGLGPLGVGPAVSLSLVLSEPDTHPVTVVSDAVWPAVFTRTGVIVAAGAGVSASGVVAVATINAVAGGAFVDILPDRGPFTLFDDFYASCTVPGASGYLLAGSLGAAGHTAAVVCAVVTVVSQLVALTHDWELPTVQGLGLVEK